MFEICGCGFGEAAYVFLWPATFMPCTGDRSVCIIMIPVIVLVCFMAWVVACGLLVYVIGFAVNLTQWRAAIRSSGLSDRDFDDKRALINRQIDTARANLGLAQARLRVFTRDACRPSEYIQ